MRFFSIGEERRLDYLLVVFFDGPSEGFELWLGRHGSVGLDIAC
jgi:hypothetical protein